MTTRLDYCGCRWCYDPHPGGLVLFVTLPSNEYASRSPREGMVKSLRFKLEVAKRKEEADPTHADRGLVPELERQLAWYESKTDEPVGPGWEANASKHTFGRLMIPPGGFDGRDIDEVIALRVPWACDNGSFNTFDEPRFRAMMDRLAGKPYCHFVAAPDVVWNKFPPRYPGGPWDPDRQSAIQTIRLFEKWSPLIREWGLPAAMVAQDGLENYEVPWELMDAYFVGGSDGWKTGAESEHLIREAQSRGLWVHVGRVSSKERIKWCRAVGASSFDGSAFGRFRDAQDKRDGLGRLQAGLLTAAAPIEDRLFVTDLEGNHLQKEEV